MTVNQPAGRPVQRPATVSGVALPAKLAERNAWQVRSDAVQLSRLGSVLNVFASDASASLSRVDRLQKAFSNRSYVVSGDDVGKKLIAEMLVQG